jgi:hypothetical protein
MSKRVEIDNELQEVAGNVANLLIPATSYWVPPYYFDNLADRILWNIRLKAGISVPYNAPKGYFNTLATQVIKKVNTAENNEVLTTEEELKNIAPGLIALQKKNPYTVPANYFALPNVTTITNNHKPTTKVVKLKNWLLWSAAAVFISVLGLGVIKFINTANIETKVEKQFATVEDNELINYVSYFATGDATLADNTKEHNDVYAIFHATSTEELQAFLEQQTQKAEN